MNSDILVSASENGVLTFTFNRPEKKNALTKAMYTTMTEALHAASTDPKIKVVLIRGQETAFTAGNDLIDFNNRDPKTKSPGLIFLETIHEFEKPIVAAVANFAIGIGVTMLLHCDLVYTAANTRFRMPFINLGLVPEGGSSLLIPLRIGHQRAARLLMLGEFFDAQEAVEIGIASKEVPLDSLFEQAQKSADYLTQLPQRAVFETKRLMRRDLSDKVSQTIKHEAQLFSTMLQTTESQELRNKALSSDG